MQFDGVLFDLDGTLIDSLPDIAANVNRALAEFGLPPLPQETVRRFVGYGVRHLVEGCFAGRVADLDLAVRGFRRHYVAHPAERTTLYPGVRETLGSLANVACLGIVTNKPQDVSEAVLRHFGIDRCFRCVLGGDAFPLRKPDPGPVLEAMRRLGVSGSRSLMVGDGVPDLQAGRAAHARVCFARYGYASGQSTDSLEADFTIDGFAELSEIVDGRRRSTSP